MKDDIQIIRHALQAAKTNVYLHRRGGLHKLWDHPLEATRALDRIEQQILPTQIPLLPTHIADTADGRSYTHKRPEPNTMPPCLPSNRQASSRPNNPDTVNHKRGA